LPAHIKQCVKNTANDVRTASSARDLYQKVAPSIQEHTLGSRSYLRDWATITQRGLTKQAIYLYLRSLYNRAIRDSTPHAGKKKTITILGTDETSTVWSSHRRDRRSLDAYFVRVAVNVSGESQPTVIIVLAISDRGKCLFGDIALLQGSSELWFSNQVDAAALGIGR
jgi:hypothetical protein